MTPTRIGVFGWGLVAPGARDIDAFATMMLGQDSQLSRFDGFGPSNFLVGNPSFDFAAWRPWIDARFPPNRYPLLERKFGDPAKFAIASFIQALGQNPAMEDELRALGPAAQVIVGGGLTDLPTYDRLGRTLERVQRRWNRFWAQPERNAALRRHLAGTLDATAPADPRGVDDELARDDAEDAWWSYWAARSDALAEYLAALREIEGVDVGEDVDTAKASVIKAKQRGARELRVRWGAPEAPWEQSMAPALWNIASTPSSQISMLGHITGMCFSPYAACSTFGFALKLGMDAIQRGEAKLVVVGATDPPPNPLSVAGFYDARVISHDGEVSKPLTGLRGTHVAGGATVWIIGDLDHYRAKGWRPLGLEPVAVGVTADADHIITPSKAGAIEAIRIALAKAHVAPEEIGAFDMHATGTPGDLNELELLREVLPASCCFSARKGRFGHGMGAGGGWELTAQYLGHVSGAYFPTPITADELHPRIRAVHRRFVLRDAVPVERPWVGKLSMGVGGVNACVISRTLPD
ncbi:MAG: beta-ketoacyl synthase [Deltaproteobacteria bacterium]|nr:beta-ketoacyl synthase [Deltaproteobacteria bacterium]MBK8237997.1 beta-ketoacyl synthase [Deltaproteobacteria bacterium]MBK8718662.1 beta-ketoacyl synthase [Deltaproteobacteria bacterium]MBP7290134.1 beta-ketoacyl synthase [Nannocystaceae bacterium]